METITVVGRCGGTYHTGHQFHLVFQSNSCFSWDETHHLGGCGSLEDLISVMFKPPDRTRRNAVLSFINDDAQFSYTHNRTFFSDFTPAHWCNRGKSSTFFRLTNHIVRNRFCSFDFQNISALKRQKGRSLAKKHCRWWFVYSTKQQDVLVCLMWILYRDCCELRKLHYEAIHWIPY